MQTVSSSSWLTAGRIVILVLVPVVLILTSVRLLFTPGFIRLNYGLPGFPADPYGLTQEDRLRLAPIALDYLLSEAGIEYLSDLRFEDGSSVYNARELRHMEDVKRVTQAALSAWKLGLFGLITVGAVIWRAAGTDPLWSGLQAGARLTLLIMGALLLFLALAFSVLFVGFHQVFFQPGTWIFRHSDTLIRLFPERFWQGAFGAIGLATAGQAGALWLLCRSLLRR